MDLSQWEWTCHCCGRRKRGVPDLGFIRPIHHGWALEGDPEYRVLRESDDICEMEIQGQSVFFIRCVLCLPIRDTDGAFGCGVWSSLSRQNYQRYTGTSGDGKQGALGPMFGYLANRIPAYPDTLNMKLDVLPQDNGLRPVLRIQDEHAGHRLWLDQNEGLSMARLEKILSTIMPCDGRA